MIVDGNKIIFNTHTVYLESESWKEGKQETVEYVFDMAVDLMGYPETARGHAQCLRDLNNDGSWRIELHKGN